MSIIYDALRKSQQARAAKAAPIAVARRLPKIQRKNIIITLLILTCIFTILAVVTIPGGPSLKLPSLLGHNKAQPAAIVASAPRLMLDGVFLSDTEKMAMINRRSYHEGDSINGMKVISIAFDQVKLRGNSRSVTLTSELTQLN